MIGHDVPPQLARLADGRDLLLFEDEPRPPREVVDTRDLPERSSPSQFRYDEALDEWTIVASHRQTRTFLPRSDECPLCPSRDGRESEVPTSDFDVAVFENRFPALGPGDANRPTDPKHPEGGRAEVVVFSSDHTARLFELSHARRRTVGRAWADRVSALSERLDVAYVFVFENSGRDIGVTLQHPHGQIYGSPFVPNRIRTALEAARRHHDEYGGCLFCAMLEHALADVERVVSETEHFVAYVPQAARWPYEVHVAPRRHLPDLAALSEAERDEAMEVYADLLRRLDALFPEETPYIAAWQQAPVRQDRDLAHVSLQLFTTRRAPGKLKYLAGSESALGVFVNDILPNDAAARLRELGATP